MDLGSLFQQLIGGVQGTVGGIGDSLNQFVNGPSTQSRGKVYGKLPDIKINPKPALATQMTSPDGGFKFQMGLKDYSFVRPQLEKLFNAKKNPPLQKYINEFIKAGEKHRVDPRVLVGISGAESTFGKQYPTDSFNPFGYLVDMPPIPPGVTGREKELLIWQGLRNAGFTSLPHAIDALTARFSEHPINQPPKSYATFREDPTIQNLQAAYNATPSEAEKYIKNLTEFSTYYQ